MWRAYCVGLGLLCAFLEYTISRRIVQKMQRVAGPFAKSDEQRHASFVIDCLYWH
jgi:hypothetical protein